GSRSVPDRFGRTRHSIIWLSTMPSMRDWDQIGSILAEIGLKEKLMEPPRRGVSWARMTLGADPDRNGAGAAAAASATSEASRPPAPRARPPRSNARRDSVR